LDFLLFPFLTNTENSVYFIFFYLILSTLANKELEFKKNVEILLNKNKTLRENFEVYDNNKDIFYKKYIGDIKKKHQKKLEVYLFILLLT
jgi:hypothetical protein